MKRLFFPPLILTAIVALALEEPHSNPVANIQTQEKPQVEVVFVLDSTGSMGALIEGAKQKIWAIANEIIQQKPTPEVRMGLVTYRDKGDEYITKVFDITDDIDAIYGYLQSITAGGGGDVPESVNQALDEAVNKMEWSTKEREVYRVIFLVGDAPPHMDYQDDVKYPDTCKTAVEKHIIINTIQCGNEPSCTPIWRDIAVKSEGEFVQVAQTGNVVAVPTPFDKEIAAETAKLNATIIVYGSTRQQVEITSKLATSSTMSSSAQADRSVFNNFASGRAVQGRGDLLYDVVGDSSLLEKSAELPELLQNMSVDEREKYIKEKQQERDEINKTIGELSAKRAEWLVTEGKKQRLNASTGLSFDESVAEMIQRQMGKVGVK